jgi:hypothetical protein
MDIKEMLKDKIEEVVDKLKSDKDLLHKFETQPVKALEDILGIDLPDDQVQALIDGVKAKLSLDKLGNALGGLGGLFGKK